MKNKNFIVGFIATVFISVITTSSYAYVDYTCNCGYDQINDGDGNWLYNNAPMCSGSKTVECIVSKNSSSFVYRASGTYYEPACSFCFCSTHISEWENTSTAGVLIRSTTVPYDYNDYTCNSNVTNEWACSSGYYGFYEPDFMIYECLECPWLYDDNGGKAHGLTEYANKDTTITDCYIQESDLRGMYFKGETGDYVLEGGDCYYSK